MSIHDPQRRPKRSLIAGSLALALVIPATIGFGLAAPAFAEDAAPETIIVEQDTSTTEETTEVTEEVVEEDTSTTEETTEVTEEETTDEVVEEPSIMSLDTVTKQEVAFYIYNKLDDSESAAWTNSGPQMFCGSQTGTDWFTALPCDLDDLPQEVCGAGWAYQQDKVENWAYAGSFNWPATIQYPNDNIGWPPIYDAKHGELSEFITVPPCDDPPPPAQTCAPYGTWYTEDVAPIQGDDGLIFAGPSVPAINWLHPVTGNLQGLTGLGYTIVDAGGYHTALRIVLDPNADLADGTSGNVIHYGSIAIEPYMNGWAPGQTGTFTVTATTVAWTSKIANGNPGSQSQPIPLADLALLMPDNQLYSLGLHQGTNSIAGQFTKVAAITGCVNEDFVPTPPTPIVPESPVKTDVCGVENDSFTLPGAEPGETESVTDEGTYTAEGDPTKGEDVVITFVPNEGSVAADIEGVDYLVDENENAIWTFVYTDEDCPVVKPAVQHVVICGVDNDTVITPGTVVENAEGITETDEFYYVIDSDGTDTPGTITVLVIPKDGITVAEPGDGDTYVIDKEGNASWTFVDDDAACPTDPPATTGLPNTGATIPLPLGVAGVLLLLVGGAFVAFELVKQHRRKVVNAV